MNLNYYYIYFFIYTKIANRSQVASYVVLSSNGQTFAFMIAAQLTVVYVRSKSTAFLLAAFSSVINAIMLSCVVLYNQHIERQKSSIKGSSSANLSPLELFFGKGQEKSDLEFWKDLEVSLRHILKKNRWERALTTLKGQILIKEILLSALPSLPGSYISSSSISSSI